jgi:hypothetical protein
MRPRGEFVSESRPARPLLATIICIYEAFIAILALAWYFLIGYLNTYLAIHPHPNPLYSALSWSTYCVAAAAAIALWQMRRSAFYLVVARFGILLLWIFFTVLRFVLVNWLAFHPARSESTAQIVMRCLVCLITLGGVALSAAIVWYVRDITSPKSFPLPVTEPRATS